MLSVSIYKSDDWYIGFRFYGHANYSENGKDIVCAATSILAQNCVNTLEAIVKIGFDFKSDEESGLLELIIKKDGLKTQDKLKEASLIIESMSMGIKGISEIYPKNVKISNKEVRL